MTNPNEPTLTCSEVVERLAKCITSIHSASGEQGQDLSYTSFDREQATAILHSWRERRVQELSGSEICRRQAEYFSQLMTLAKRNNNPEGFALNDERKRVCEDLAETIERAEDEWREQIRKGAKHE